MSKSHPYKRFYLMNYAFIPPKTSLDVAIDHPCLCPACMAEVMESAVAQLLEVPAGRPQPTTDVVIPLPVSGFVDGDGEETAVQADARALVALLPSGQWLSRETEDDDPDVIEVTLN